MRWAKSVKYQTVTEVDGETYNVSCLSDFDDDYELSINGEFVCDVAELPNHEQVLEYIDHYATIETMARRSFLQRSL